MEKQITPIQELKNLAQTMSDNLSGDSGFIGRSVLRLLMELDSVKKERQMLISFSNKLVEIQVDGCGCYKNNGMEEEAEKLFDETFKTK